MIAAIIKTVHTRVFTTSNDDPTTATVEYDRWLYIETYLVIITASIPCIRSLVRSIPGQPITSSNIHELRSRCVVSSIRTSQMGRIGFSPDGKRMINASKGNVSDEGIPRDDDAMHESACSRESTSVMNCV